MQQPEEQEVIARLTKWAQERDDIRAMLLTSTRANPNAHLDRFSDYDIILAVRDIHPFIEDEAWLEDFGKVLVVYRDPVRLEHGLESFCRVTNYRDRTKIDYTVWPVELLQKIGSEPDLPAYLDDGYKILLDKDHLTESLKPPTFTSYIPNPPSEDEYLTVIEEFFNDAIYVAKSISRGNLFSVKLSLDHVMKLQCLLKMLEWRVEISQDWSVKTGAYGKGLKQYIAPETWAKLERTYVGAGKEENWKALFETIFLFRDAAFQVAAAFGYAYPREMDKGVMAYLKEIQKSAL